jgi:hypothetical protein
LVVGAVLTAALALVALPGLAGSRAPTVPEPIPAGAFQELSVSANEQRSPVSIGALDAAHDSAAALAEDSSIVEPGEKAAAGPAGRAATDQRNASAGSIRKPAKYTLTGFATFYDNGTTAMRLPRGTVVVICGDGGCIDRVVNDYGPQKKSRVVDLYRPDFFAICGCQWFAGTTTVTVYVY